MTGPAATAAADPAPQLAAAPVRSARVVVLVLLAAAALVACGSDRPVDATPSELVTQQDRLDGETIRTIGWIDTYDDPRHYWVEDRDHNRTELFPHDVVEPYVGREVLVEGRFSYAEDEGRSIEVERIEAAGDADSAVASGRLRAP